MAKIQEQSNTVKSAIAGTTESVVDTLTFFDPETAKYVDARKMMPSLPVITDFDKEIMALIEDNDFWQNALRYCGPLPAPGPAYDAAMAVLKKSYAPILKLREVLRRHVRGVVGREPHFEVVFPEMSEDRRQRRKRKDYETSRTGMEVFADEVDKVQGDTWDERGEHSLCELFLKRLRSVGRAYLRYGVPPGLLAEGVDRDSEDDSEEAAKVYGVSAENWQEAYKLFYLELAPRGSAFVYLDPFTMKKTAFFAYTEPKPAMPGARSKAKKTRKCVQLSWIETQENDDGSKIEMTRVRVVRDDKTNDEWQLDTGGHLLVIEASMAALLTPDLLRLQDIGCSIATMVKVNDDVAGFPQTTMMDVERPSVSVQDPNDPTKKKRVEVPMPTGARTIQYAYSYADEDKDGNPIKDANGNPVIRQGTIHYRLPVNSEPMRADAEWFFKEIYLATNQEHIVARRSATASADMLVEMRADFADSLMETQPHLERALREVFHARLCASAYLADDQAALAAFKAGKVRVEAQLNAGPLSIAERAEIKSRVKENLLSEQTVAIMLGTGDWDAEKAQIQEEQREKAGDGVPVVKTIIPAVKPKATPEEPQEPTNGE